LDVIQTLSNHSGGEGGSPNDYVIFDWHLTAYRRGGGQEGPKCDYVIFECSLTSRCLNTIHNSRYRNIIRGSVKQVCFHLVKCQKVEILVRTFQFVSVHIICIENCSKSYSQKNKFRWQALGFSTSWLDLDLFIFNNMFSSSIFQKKYGPIFLNVLSAFKSVSISIFEGIKEFWAGIQYYLDTIAKSSHYIISSLFCEHLLQRTNLTRDIFV